MVKCPTCGAEAGHKCKSVFPSWEGQPGGVIVGSHQGRLVQYFKWKASLGKRPLTS